MRKRAKAYLRVRTERAMTEQTRRQFAYAMITDFLQNLEKMKTEQETKKDG